MFCGEVTSELRKAMEEFERRFGEGEFVPLEMIPDTESAGDLVKNIRKCLKVGKNLLPEIYGWKLDGSAWY